MISQQDLNQFAEWYIARRRRGTGRNPSPATVRGKWQNVRTAGNVAGTTSLEGLARFLSKRPRAESLLDSLSLHQGPGAHKLAVQALLDLGEYARAQGWPKSTVLPRDLPKVVAQGKRMVVYTDDEIERFVSAARGTDLRWWALLTFLADTGRRIGEALSLEWDWLHLDEEVPYFELPFQKNGQPQLIPLGQRLAQQVFTPRTIEWMQTHGQAHRSPATYVFPGTYRTYHSRFCAFCEVTDLPNHGFHRFRHTYATRQLIDGVPLQAVSALLGHSNPAITGRVYSHVNAMNFAQFAR